MTQRVKLLVLLSSTLVLGATARATVADTSLSPYQGIAASNVFRLNPLGVSLPDPPAAPLPRVTLAGITTFSDRRIALLKVRMPASPGQQAREVSCILSEGQRAGPIEVLQINEKAGSVKVNNSGTVIVLTFEKDGPVLRNIPLPPAPPPVPFEPGPRPR